MTSLAPAEKIRKARIQIICNRGLHMRCAHQLVNLLHQFKSEIRITKGDKIVDARCLMDLLLLEIGDKAVIGGHATVIGHSFENGHLVLKKVRM